jgi:hypothetical protein
VAGALVDGGVTGQRVRNVAGCVGGGH